jgi:hypothetical protein
MPRGAPLFSQRGALERCSEIFEVLLLPLPGQAGFSLFLLNAVCGLGSRSSLLLFGVVAQSAFSERPDHLVQSFVSSSSGPGLSHFLPVELSGMKILVRVSVGCVVVWSWVLVVRVREHAI